MHNNHLRENETVIKKIIFTVQIVFFAVQLQVCVNFEFFNVMYISFAAYMQNFHMIFAIASVADLEFMVESTRR